MKKYYFIFEEGSKINQIICAILINMPVFAYGAAIGWMSPMTLLLQSANSPRGEPLTDSEISWMGSSAYLVCVAADFLMGFLSDKLGRKTTLLITSASAAVCWIVKLSSFEVWAFVVARASVGFLMAGSFVTCPLYTKDISEDSIRGVLGTLVILFQTSGNLFLYVIGDILSYRTILWVCLSIPTVHLVLFTMMPESPSYLVKTGKLDEAAKALAWLRCRDLNDNSIQREIELIKKEQQRDEESSKFVFKAIFQDKILFRAFRIAIFIALAREVCGAIPVTNFAGDIFAKASEGSALVLTPNQQAMMLGAVQVAGSALGSSVIEKVGRKPLLFITSFISGLSMILLGSWFLVRDYEIWAPDWIPIASLCVCIFCDSSGLQPLSVVITGEMFSFKYRGTVMATAMSLSSVACFIQILFFKPIISSIGVHVAFYFFGFICLLAALYTILVVPETKVRCLDEIYYDLKTKKEKAADLKMMKKVVV